MENSAFHLILQAGLVVKIVLLILLFFSVFSWAIIIFKHRFLSRAVKETESFLTSFRDIGDSNALFTVAKRFTLSPISNVFKAVYMDSGRHEKDRDVMRRAIKRYEVLETEKMERYLGFLATTGSSTPFIGLFGTVWGIMNSFRGIGATGAASLAVVAPGIAEALIATAMGLVAAIPAVIAYNYYLSRVKSMIIQMEDFSADILKKLGKESSES
jgi:biopolymer transport protein TolQ